MTYISLDLILSNPDNPRQIFDPVALQELANSVKEHGILQPISVERISDGYFVIQDGERRLRAARIAGLSEIPCHELPSTNGSGSHDRLARALAANLQRQDLNPIEEGKAFKKTLFVQDKGQKNMLRAFVECVKNGLPAPISFEEIKTVTLATFKILESIKTGKKLII